MPQPPEFDGNAILAVLARHKVACVVIGNYAGRLGAETRFRITIRLVEHGPDVDDERVGWCAAEGHRVTGLCWVCWQ
jgi:hypothetical protein